MTVASAGGGDGLTTDGGDIEGDRLIRRDGDELLNHRVRQAVPHQRRVGERGHEGGVAQTFSRRERTRSRSQIGNFQE